MAKDGINRGGRRVRAADKPKPLAEKIAAGEDAADIVREDILSHDTYRQ